MKNKQQLYVVRGSGYGIDNALVVIADTHEVDGEIYFSVNPATPRHVGTNSILIHEKYLQPIDNRLKRYVYTFTISKKCIDTGNFEQDLLVIDGAYRNMAVKTILKRLESELAPILRLE